MIFSHSPKVDIFQSLKFKRFHHQHGYGKDEIPSHSLHRNQINLRAFKSKNHTLHVRNVHSLSTNPFDCWGSRKVEMIKLKSWIYNVMTLTSILEFLISKDCKAYEMCQKMTQSSIRVF